MLLGNLRLWVHFHPPGTLSRQPVLSIPTPRVKTAGSSTASLWPPPPPPAPGGPLECGGALALSSAPRLHPGRPSNCRARTGVAGPFFVLTRSERWLEAILPAASARGPREPLPEVRPHVSASGTVTPLGAARADARSPGLRLPSPIHAGRPEPSPGQYLSPPPLQSLRIFSRLPPHGGSEEVEPFWLPNPPWASSPIKSIHPPDLLPRHSRALPSTPLPAPLLPPRSPPDILVCPGQCSFPPPSCFAPRASLASPLSWETKVQDTFSSPRDPPGWVGGCVCVWRTPGPPAQLLLPGPGGGVSPVRRARMSHRATLGPRMAQSRASWGWVWRGFCLGVGPSGSTAAGAFFLLLPWHWPSAP